MSKPKQEYDILMNKGIVDMTCSKDESDISCYFSRALFDPKYYELIYVDNLKIINQIAKGSYGIVFEGEISENPIVVKVGIKRVEDMIHETFVSLLGINPLTETCKNFPKLFGYMICNQPEHFGIEYCSQDKSRPPYMFSVYEYIKDGVSMFEALESPNFKKAEFGQVILQMFTALQYIVDKNKKYSHNDLHLDNVMISFYEKPITNHYYLSKESLKKLGFLKEEQPYDDKSFSINTQIVPVILDQGLSYLRYDGTDYYHDISKKYSIPAQDIFKFFGSILRKADIYDKNIYVFAKNVIRYMFTFKNIDIIDEEIESNKYFVLYDYMAKVSEMVLEENDDFLTEKYNEWKNMIYNYEYIDVLHEYFRVFGY